MKSANQFPRVPSADRTLDLLELLSGRAEGVSFNELITLLGIPRSSLSGLMRTLIARRYVMKTADGRRFRLGMKVLELGRSYLHDGNILEACKNALPRLLQTFGETAHVAVLDGADVIYMAAEFSQHSMRINSPLGKRIPAYATAVGKSLLAMLPDHEIDRRLPVQFEPQTPGTIATRADLKRELRQIRRLGYAYDAEEFAIGLHCVAVPVFDETGQAVASIGISIPTARLNEVDIAQIPSVLLATAQEISPTPYNQPIKWHSKGIKIAWSMASLRVQAYQIIYRTVENVCTQSDSIEVIWTDAHEDASKQVVDVTSLLALQPDVIVIHPAHALFAEQLFDMAAQAKVPAINFQRPVRSQAVDFFIGGDTFKQGQLTAEFVARSLGGSGNCAMIEGDPYNDNARNFAQGVRHELRSYPQLQITADQPSLFWSRERASEIAEAMLTEYGDRLDAFIVANDDMAGGVAEVIAEHKLTQKIILVGGDGDLEALERIHNGTQQGSAFQNWMELSRDTLRLAAEIAQGTLDHSQLQRRSIFNEPPGPPIYVKDLPYIFVDRTNLDVLERFWTEALTDVLPRTGSVAKTGYFGKETEKATPAEP